MVTDAGVVSRLSVLLSGRGAAGQPPKAATAAPRRSQPPSGDDPLGSEYLHPGDSGKDGRVVEHGPHDGDLPVKVEGLPPVA
jgi:hypothetical protein